VHHYDLQGTDWRHDEQRKAYRDAIRPYDVIAVFHGHTGTGVYRWKPEAAASALNVVNTGQTENGFFVVQISDARIRLAYRAKIGVKITRESGRERRKWDGSWGWRHLHQRELRQ